MRNLDWGIGYIAKTALVCGSLLVSRSCKSAHHEATFKLEYWKLEYRKTKNRKSQEVRGLCGLGLTDVLHGKRGQPGKPMQPPGGFRRSHKKREIKGQGPRNLVEASG